jgi:hypothetical protein
MGEHHYVQHLSPEYEVHDHHEPAHEMHAGYHYTPRTVEYTHTHHPVDHHYSNDRYVSVDHLGDVNHHYHGETPARHYYAEKHDASLANETHHAVDTHDATSHHIATAVEQHLVHGVGLDHHAETTTVHRVEAKPMSHPHTLHDEHSLHDVHQAPFELPTHSHLAAHIEDTHAFTEHPYAHDTPAHIPETFIDAHVHHHGGDFYGVPHEYHMAHIYEDRHYAAETHADTHDGHH